MNGSEAESTPGSEETAVYKLPAGAASEYELYETVVDFLNKGFHYSALKDVFDQNLWFVTRSKMEAESENIFTLGMKYDEACDLIARLKEKASNMDFLIDEYGEINMGEKSKEGLETYEYDDYENWDKDLFLNFPRMYGMKLGTYISGDATSMYIEYTEIEGRYYLIAFTYSKSGVGG